MRVRISYGIDIEEIPEQAATLGDGAILELKEAVSRLSRTVESIEECAGDYDMVVSMLENTRKQLTKADLIIVDLQAILQGLHNYYNGEKNVSEGRPTLDPSGDTTAETKDPGEG
tara:strand:- start:375 stop:719 length:345 start_codon:yes stop_codon:yes gene_type:complete